MFDEEMRMSVQQRAGSVAQKDWNLSPPFPPPPSSCESELLMAELLTGKAGVQQAFTWKLQELYDSLIHCPEYGRVYRSASKKIK